MVVTDTDWEDFDDFDNFGISICTSGTRPTAHEGRHIYETDTNKTMRYTGAAWVELASSGGTTNIFVPITHIVGFSLTTDDDFPCWEVNSSTNGVARGSIQIPPDFSSGAKVYVIARATSSGTGDLEVSADYGAIGEAHNTHTNNAGGTIAMTTNIIKSADVNLTSASVGDFVGIRNDTFAAYNDLTIRLYGFVLEYTI